MGALLCLWCGGQTHLSIIDTVLVALPVSSAILKVKDNPEDPSLKAVFGQHILVSERQ